jgi:hypothetical protein
LSKEEEEEEEGEFEIEEGWRRKKKKKKLAFFTGWSSPHIPHFHFRLCLACCT